MKLEHFLSALLLVALSSGCAQSVALRNQYGEVEVSSVGATVLRYVPAGGEEVLYRSPRMSVTDTDFYHGGIPVAWPWFGRYPGTDSGEMIHGFSRRLKWQIVERTNSRVRLEVSSSDETRAIFPGDFHLVSVIELGERLTLTFQMENTGLTPWRYTAGFHPFFHVSDNAQLAIRGVKGLDRIPAEIDTSYPADDRHYVLVDAGGGRVFDIVAAGTQSVCLWNAFGQWPEIYPAGEGHDIFAVEPLTRNPDTREPETLNPGEMRVMKMSLAVRAFNSSDVQSK